ncbi:MAG: hypothetical protein QM820_05895 [Minicystis sp.]
MELGRDLARLHPASPEGAEAKALVAADYARIFPLLQKAENLLARQSLLYVIGEKVRWCMWDKTNNAADPETFEGRNYTEPNEAHRPTCEREVSPERIPEIDADWKKTLDEIHDPSFTKPLEERLKSVKEKGLYEPEPWPKPAGQK